MTDPFLDSAILRERMRGWIAQASLKELVLLLEEIGDALVERHSPAAALLSEASVIVRRQAAGNSGGTA
jgi:hypothetical protein